MDSFRPLAGWVAVSAMLVLGFAGLAGAMQGAHVLTVQVSSPAFQSSPAVTAAAYLVIGLVIVGLVISGRRRG